MKKIILLVLFYLWAVPLWACDLNEPQIVIYLEHVAPGRDHNVKIDKCLVPIIQALQNAGITTVSCCCGHGKGDGYILLEDRLLILTAPNNEKEAKRRYYEDFDRMSQMNMIHRKELEIGK